MRKLLLACVMTFAALGLTATAANAYTLSPGGNITARSIQLDFTGPFGATMACDVTLSGSLRTSGVEMDTVGAITSSSLANCTRDATVLVSAANPWPIVLKII